MEKAKNIPSMAGLDLASAVSTPTPYHWTQGVDACSPSDRVEGPAPARFHVVAYDFGIKHNILRRLVQVGCRVTVVPALTSAEDALALKPDGVFLSNGSGDPEPLRTKADGLINFTIPAATVALAKYPNVSVKVSASPGLSRQPYPFRDVAEHIKRVFDAYGPQRSYWGTDLTNTYAKGSYRQRITQFTEELPFLSESDKDWVMGRAIMQRLKWT